MNNRELSPFESEGSLAEQLEREGIENVERAFDIPEERDIDGQQIDARITWLKIGTPPGEGLEDIPSVEGKLYLPSGAANQELILFTPGFPGGNAGRFEQRYAKTFTDEGYAFYTVRHNGTSLANGEVSAEILNSPKRMELAQETGEEYVGDKECNPEEVINEPVASLMSLHKRFKRIHLMGQSMGVAASYNALRRLQDYPEVTGKIGNIVGIAGYVGGTTDKAEGLWDGMKMPMRELVEYELEYAKKVGLNFELDAQGFEDSLRRVAEANAKMEVPEHVGNVLVYTPEDPIIAGPDREEENSVANYGPSTKRKIIIRDETNLSAPKAHSMLWIAPENLVRAVRAQVSKGMHYIKVPNTAVGPDGHRGMIEKG